MQTDIYKAGGSIIENRKLLITRTKGKDIFFAPGGKLESGETAIQAVIRELKEELHIDVKEDDLKPFGAYTAEAAGQPGKYVHMTVFLVTAYRGGLTPSKEIEEMYWTNATNVHNVAIGSIFEHEVMPRLKQQGFID